MKKFEKCKKRRSKIGKQRQLQETFSTPLRREKFEKGWKLFGLKLLYVFYRYVYNASSGVMKWINFLFNVFFIGDYKSGSTKVEKGNVRNEKLCFVHGIRRMQ